MSLAIRWCLEVTESLSDIAPAVGSTPIDVRISPEFDAYSKVIINIGEDDDGNEISYISGNSTGRTLEIENPWGTQEMADTLLSKLQLRNFQYQPYRATRALLDPSAEIGDGVSVNSIYSGIYTQNITFNSLMASDISAPADEEFDHEFPYVPKEQRQFKRETSYTRSQLKINRDSIEAEVSRAIAAEGELGSRITLTASSIESEVKRATEAEGALSSRVTQNADAITAKVSASGGNSSSFGWELTASQWRLFSGGSTVLTADRNGLTVNGKINSKTGNIGGFNIGNTAIYNNISTFGGSQSTGVYLGTNGIQLGQGFKVAPSGYVEASNLKLTGGSIALGSNFSVDSSGNVRANNMTLSGTLNVGGQYISADTLRSGAQSAYNNASYWSGGASGGYSFSNATNSNSGIYPNYFRASQMNCSSLLFFQGYQISRMTTRVKNASGTNIYLYYLGWSSVE